MKDKHTKAESFQSPIQWYPGHIAKYERELRTTLKPVDVVIEVLDARLPETTRNRRIEKTIESKPILLILNKADLADANKLKHWKTHYQKEFKQVLVVDAKTGQIQQQVIKAVTELAEERIQQLIAKGYKRRPVRVMVVGMPNVGKSTLINRIVGKKKAKTGHKAGVTRQSQWIKINPQVELLDSPGLIPPALESEDDGYKLALVDSVGDAAFDTELAGSFLINLLETLYPKLLRKHFSIPDEEEVTLYSMANARRFFQSGETPDESRMAQVLLSDFRHGRLGRLTLDSSETLMEKTV